MEKLQKFNRILFTIMSIAIIILVIAILVSLINTFFLSNDPYTYKKKKEIISTEKAQDLLNANKHAQIISLMEMHPIKNSNSLFIIPVSQVSLKEPRQRRDMIRIDQINIPTYPKYESYSSYYGYYKKDELLNNLLIYSLLDNSSYPIFDKRICITDFINFSVNNELYIYIVATDNDSNHDDILDDNDLKYIYIYNISKKEMKKLTSTAEFILHTTRILETDLVVIKVGIDEDGNGEYSLEHEPITLKTLNVVNFKYDNFIDPMIHEKLQDILDGK